MAEPVETIKTTTPNVNCDGGGGALGHPRVYLQIKPQVGHIDCPYCSRRYVLDAAAAKAAAHH